MPNPANPQTLNRYSYCLNNPLRYIDPSGHSLIGWAIKKIIDIATGGGGSSSSGGSGSGGGSSGGGGGSSPTPIPLPVHLMRPPGFVECPCSGGISFGLLDIFQGFLDLVGLIPLLGEPADGFNGVLYAIEGDWTNAGISTAAMIPFFGWGATAGKWGMRAYRWYDSATLAKHFTKHGADFGASTADEYANMAGDFLRRAQAERLPTKVDSSGIIRVYDPPTNTFGVYNPDGMTVTFFKPDPNVHKLPTNMDYWNSQPGVSP